MSATSADSARAAEPKRMPQPVLLVIDDDIEVTRAVGDAAGDGATAVRLVHEYLTEA